MRLTDSEMAKIFAIAQLEITAETAKETVRIANSTRIATICLVIVGFIAIAIVVGCRG